MLRYKCDHFLSELSDVADLSDWFQRQGLPCASTDANAGRTSQLGEWAALILLKKPAGVTRPCEAGPGGLSVGLRVDSCNPYSAHSGPNSRNPHCQYCWWSGRLWWC